MRPAFRKIRAEDDREVVLTYPRDDAVAIVQALHGAHDWPLRSLANIVTPHTPLVRDVGEVLRVVEERRGIGVGTKPQHLAVMLAQPLKRRPGAVIVVPRCVGQERIRKTAACAEPPGRVVRHFRSRRTPEVLGEIADFVEDRDGRRVEGRRAG